VGQCIASCAQTFILGVPPKVAFNWFGHSERATATSIGALCNQLGIAIGFLMSPAVVKKGSDIPTILLIDGVICTAVSTLVILVFRGNPPTPPSSEAEEEKMEFLPAIKTLLHNRSFLVIFFSFGMTTGIFYAISTVLDEVISPAGYSSEDAGWLGFIMIMTGLVSAIVVGVLLDKYGKYRLFLMITFFGTLASYIFFILCVRENEMGLLYFTAGLLGLFMTAILPVSLQGGVECSLPVPEGFSGTMVMMSAQIFGILCIVIISLLDDMNHVTPLLTAYAFVGPIAMSCVVMLLFKENDNVIMVQPFKPPKI